MITIGLGNPGKKYQNNRHNAGHMFIDYLNKLSDQKNKSLNLKTFKTNCFMNQSGKEIEKILKKLQVTSYKIQDIFIVHDDLDIPLGKFRIDFGKGPKLHNGLKSIEETLNTKDFWRIRIGVDNRQKNGWVNGEAYVLQDFLPEEREVLEKEVFRQIVEKIKKILNLF